MNWLMLFLTVIMLFLQNVIMKQYNKNVGGFRSLIRFNIIWALSVLVFFMVIAKGRYVFHLPTLLFSVVFALAYAAVILFQVLAIRNGPLSLSVLIISYSLVIPALAGVVYLGETLKVGGILGIGMLILSLFLTNFSKSNEPLKLRWFAYAFLALLGNGVCTTSLKPFAVASGFPSNVYIIVTIILLLPFSNGLNLSVEIPRMSP